MTLHKIGGYSGHKLPPNTVLRPPQTTGSHGRSISNDKGFIEKKEILAKNSIIYQYKYFLIVIDCNTNKVISTFGNFNNEQEAKDFAKLRSIEVE